MNAASSVSGVVLAKWAAAKRGSSAKTLMALAVAMTVSLPVLARDPATVAKEATSEVAFELAECAAYYAIAAAGADVSLAPGKERDEAVASLKKSAEAAIGASAILTSQRVAAARMDLARQTMTRDMESNWENLSIIAAKYMWPCKDRVEAPDKRFAYWLREKEKLPDLPTTR